MLEDRSRSPTLGEDEEMTVEATTETTGRALIEFLSFAADKGLMNANTAGSLRGACKEVLSAIEGADEWEEVDVRTIDVADYAQRFERLRTSKYKPASLAVYKTRFKNGVEMFLSYVENPSGWKYTAERPAKDRNKNRPRPPGAPEGKAGAAFTPPPDDYMITYPFPLRHGLVVTLRLPEDLTTREADRLCNYVKSLAFEVMKELPAVSSAGDMSRAS